jgi:hypothetical protein
MRARTAFVTLALVLAPLGVRAADLVVWWDQGYYPQEDEAVREIIAAFEQETGKQVELEQPLVNEIGAKAQAAVEAGQPPDFLFGSNTDYYYGQWAEEDRLVDLSDGIGPFANLFDPDALAAATLFNATTGRRALYALPMGSEPTMSTYGATCSSRPGSPSRTSPSNGRPSGRSGATGCSRECAARAAATISTASACPCRPIRMTHASSSNSSCRRTTPTT